MSRITLDSKCRLCRAEGTCLYLKGARCISSKCPIQKKGAVKPGMHGIKSNKPTDYGIQLRAKQKAKRIYGVQEKQFKNYYVSAKKLKGLVGDNLMSLLEKRLDNVLYLSGLSLSRSHAKQIIGHNHVYVNGNMINVPSYSIKFGDVITLDQEIALKLKDSLKVEDKDFKSPLWLDVSKQNYTAKIISAPTREDMASGIDVNLIIEYYSR